MRNLKKFLVVFAAFFFVFVTSCTDGNGSGVNHSHAYTEWVIIEAPTVDTEGEAKKYCNCGENLVVKLPVLTDELVWSKKEQPATCQQKGQVVYTSEYGQVIEYLKVAEHSYSAWTITVNPTLNDEGEAERVCVYGETDTVVIPKLLDQSVWTVESENPATCQVTGLRVYSSEYGKVEYVLEVVPHAYSAWNMTKEPTLTEAGEANRVCDDCNHKEEVAVPALSDSSWTVKEEVKATYNAAGSQTYESEFGTVKVVLAKLVAPYDNKHYSSFAIDADNDKGGFVFNKLYIETAWNHAEIDINENGIGVGGQFPFRGHVAIEMVDEKTGKVKVTKTDLTYDEDGNIVYDEDGNLVLDTTDAGVTYGYVDFNTGIIVSQFNSSFNYVIVWTPFEVGVTNDDVVASSWENSMASEYVFENNVYSFFTYKDSVVFGATFENEKGENLAADECHASKYVYVKNAAGEVIYGFVNNGEKLVLVDGLEGSYTNGENTLVLSGYGAATLNGVNGEYVIASEESFTIGLYVNNEYLEVTLAENSYTSVKPMVVITFEAGEFATVEAQSANKNIVMVMPKPDHQFQAFKGWYYDAECTQPVEADFAPTENVTLYALWKTKVIINLVGTLVEDPKVLYLGEGDVIGSFLPSYKLDLTNNQVFRGWYLDAEFATSLPEEAEVTESDSNITLYAKWEELAPYYGTYYGTEIWSSNSGNYASKTLSIDENGNVTSSVSKLNNCIVESYDPETQVITLKASATSTTTYSLWFDEEAGVFATHYSSFKEIGSDYYIFAVSPESGKVAAHFGIYTTKTPTDSSNGYYARVVNITTKQGQKDIFIYNNHIYSNVTLESTNGETLTTSTVSASKTLVVKENGVVVFAVASQGASFKAEYKTVQLDAYYGTYTNGSETVVLDGTGVIKYGDKTGTYAKTESGFDVYLVDNSEYYQLTLDGSSFTIVKPMVTLTFNVGEGHVAVEAISANKNVPVTLPNGEDEGYVFNGWFLDAEFVTPVPASYVPTADATIYAKYSLPAVLTIVYNNGSDNEEVVYSVGDIATIEVPVYAKHAFAGWYTSAEFTEGSEWTNGEVINADATIYAKWEVAPIYNNTYCATEVDGKNANGSTSSLYTRTSAIINVDPYGNAPSTGYPFNKGAIVISNYDPATGTIKFMNGNIEYTGFIEATSGIIILPATAGSPVGEVLFLSPFETKNYTSNISSSYWDAGETRAIEYTYGGEVYRSFIYNGNVYFGVSFKDTDGNAVVGKECYHTPTLYVYASDNSLIAKFGFDGTKMNKLDGYEGTYTNGTDTLVIDGVKVAKLNNVTGSYALADGEFTADLYVNGEYFELTLNKETMTYSVNKPMVDITFDADGKADLNAVNVNKNISITLPTPENEGFIFRGWFLEATFENEADMNYIPTVSITLYAKWDAKVSLTVVYGKDITDVVLYYGVGDVTAPVEPLFTDGQVFDGWYLDSSFNTPYTVGEITESTTIYAKWKDAIALYGEYKGANVYGSTASGSNASVTNGKSVTIDATGKATGTSSGEVKDYNPETGMFKLYSSSSTYRVGRYDEATGVLVINYGTSGEDLKTDVYVYVKADTSATSLKDDSSYWAAGKIKLFKMTISGGSQESMLIFIYNNEVYGNVTYTSTDGEVSIKDLYKVNQVSVYDKDGKLIANFVKGNNGLELAK